MSTEEGTKVEAPQLTMGERKEQRVLAILGSPTGWSFAERVTLDASGRSELTGARVRTGVMIRNVALDKDLFMGEGEARKYTDVVIPSLRKERTPRQPKAQRAPGAGQLVMIEDLGEVDLDVLAASLV